MMLPDFPSTTSVKKALQTDVTSSLVAAGKGDTILTVVDQLENLVTQASVPGADLAGLLSQAQDIVNNA